MTNLETDIIEILGSGPLILERIVRAVGDRNASIMTREIHREVGRLEKDGRIVCDPKTLTYSLAKTYSVKKWTDQEIESELILILGRNPRALVRLDAWARENGIPTSDLFHILVSGPEFVYRELTEGNEDWMWTLADTNEDDSCNDIADVEANTEITSDGRVVYASGAQRSSDAEKYRYDLVSPIGMRRLAETYAEGARKYGASNWLKGFPMSSLSNHVFKHLFQWVARDKSEDHLAHAAWGLMALMHFEETRPDLDDRHSDDDSLDAHVTPMLQRRIDDMIKDGTAIC